ncbi:MAG: hypothetical protein AAF850_06650 [Pseudomonadota bacterium]
MHRLVSGVFAALCVAAQTVLFAGPAQAAPEWINSISEPTAELPEAFKAKQEQLLAQARASVDANPQDAMALIWVGRRLGYLGRYKEALTVYFDGAEAFPDDGRFMRHAGHRLISVREFTRAVEALSAAQDTMAEKPDAVEPDGLPNTRGIPTSTTKGNIFYHLALAHYLLGDFNAAAIAWAEAAAVAENPDAAAAARYWLYISRSRAGDEAGATAALAPVDQSWPVFENTAYFEMALCFKGAGDCEALYKQADDASGVAGGTLLYGLGAKALIDGERRKARRYFDRATAAGAPTAFGVIAAEQDLANRR